MSASLDTLMDNLRLNLPGSLDGAIQLELANILDEFLDKTSAWVEQITLAIIQDQKSYTIVAPSGRINRLMRLTMPVNTTEEMDVAAWMDDPETIVLRDRPQAAGTYTAYVAIKQEPGEGLETVPEWVYDNYRLAMLHGAMFRMQMQSAKPYSNKEMAVYNGRKFNALTAQARAEVAQKYLYRGQTWRFPQGFRAGSQR